MHFLVEVPNPDSPNDQPQWIKSGLVLKFSPRSHGHSNANSSTVYTVKLIMFRPPVEMFAKAVSFIQSDKWADAIRDPYLLIDLALTSWYERIDEVAWSVTSLVRDDETVNIISP